MSAVEVRKLLAGEYFRDRDRSRAQLECLPFAVTDPRPNLDTVGVLGQGFQRFLHGVFQGTAQRGTARVPPNAQTGPDAVEVEVRIIGAAVRADAGNRADIGRNRVGKTRVGDSQTPPVLRHQQSHRPAGSPIR